MKTLLLRDVRCFGGSREFPVRPLTILLGENSTGKSSFLALTRIAEDLRSGIYPDFNDEPYKMGSFNQISSFRGGRAGRAASFAIGQTFLSTRTPNATTTIEARFVAVGSQPSVESLSIRQNQLTITVENPETKPTLLLDPDGVQIELDQFPPFRPMWSWSVLSFALQFGLDRSGKLSPPKSLGDKYARFAKVLASIEASGRRPVAFGPVRSHPQRTYEPRKLDQNPEGVHVPMALLGEFSSGAKETPNFRDGLERFGSASGLFAELTIHTFGKTGSDPFQLEIKLPGGGPRRNLIDVGYGVSQSVPIVVDVLKAPNNSTFLMQQPEVHLHPRAQAEMGTFLCQLIRERKHTILVETHSDYLVDRIRLDVRDKKGISANDVLILYFERRGTDVEVTPIMIDDQGELIASPKGYRSFFLEEEKRYFRVEE